MKDRIKAIIEDKIGSDFSTEKENPHLYNDLGFDSLDHVEIIMCLEREYDIAINYNDAFTWQTLDDVVKTCEDCIGAKK